MRKAFTLIELVVAMGILALILSFAGVIFKAGTGAQRMAMANAEIMEKLRVITTQLDADFKGMIPTYGGSATFKKTVWTNDNGEVVDITYADGIAIFANGDFQSTRQYDGDTILGNVASIYYGMVPFDLEVAPRDRVLLRRQTILAPEAPQAYSQWDGEYYCGSLEQWRIAPPSNDANDISRWSEAPILDPNNFESQMPMYLAKGVGSFTVEYLEEEDADFGTGSIPWRHPESDGSISIAPVALKVTFTLYDSKGILEKGRTFTHIVLLGD